MGLLGKLAFWKKDDDFGELNIPEPSPPAPIQQPLPQQGLPQQGLPEPPKYPGSADIAMPQTSGITEPPNFAAPKSDSSFSDSPFSDDSFTPPPKPAPTPSGANISGDQQLQLISSKLDTIKAQLETVLHRLDRLERKEAASVASEEGEQRFATQQRWRARI